jgi:hypothetical protein
MRGIFEEEEQTESEVLKDKVSFGLKYLLSPVYQEIIPNLMDNFYDKYLDNYLMIGAVLAEIRRIKRENKEMKRRLEIIDNEKQTDIRSFIQ